MSHNENITNNNIFQLIGNLSSQSTESSNIILRAISQGISSGISQGIASGNISFSFQDVIALATIFKPNDDIALRLVDGMMPKNCNTAGNEETTTKAFANPHSLVTSQDSSGLPLSVHVLDVTAEKSRAHEHTVSPWVSRNADDDTAESSCISNVSGGSADESMSPQAGISSRKRILSSNDPKKNCRLRTDATPSGKVTAINSLHELSNHISTSSNTLPVAVVTEHHIRLSESTGE